MNTKELIRAVTFGTGVSKGGLAAGVGLTQDQLQRKLHRGSLKADMLFRMLDEAGVDVRLEKDGKPIERLGRPHGLRVRAMSDGKVFDTEKAAPLAYNPEEDYELFRDRDGVCFVAYYKTQTVKRLDDDIARTYIEKYKTL